MSGLDATQVQELMHRLQSLDVDLQEAARSRVITEADYTSRLKRLRRATHQAQKLREAASAQTMPTALPSHFDLPVMSGYSRMEQKIVARFVTDTKAYTSEIASKLQQVGEWTLDAVHDAAGWLKLIWRLSWIRSQIRRIDQDIDKVRKARGVVEDFIARSEIGGLEPNPRTNQRDLIAAFTEFEAATGRVTAMRAKLRGEIARNEEMKQWLANYAMSRRLVSPEKIPPEPLAVAEAGRIVADHLMGGAKLANERLVVARRLATSMNQEVADSRDSNLNQQHAKHQPLKNQENKLPLPQKKNKKSEKGARL
jgi:hypothetical protein